MQKLQKQKGRQVSLGVSSPKPERSQMRRTRPARRRSQADGWTLARRAQNDAPAAGATTAGSPRQSHTAMHFQRRGPAPRWATVRFLNPQLSKGIHPRVASAICETTPPAALSPSKTVFVYGLGVQQRAGLAFVGSAQTCPSASRPILTATMHGAKGRLTPSSEQSRAR